MPTLPLTAANSALPTNACYFPPVCIFLLHRVAAAHEPWSHRGLKDEGPIGHREQQSGRETDNAGSILPPIEAGPEAVFVNGRPATNQPLRSGDLLHLGATAFYYQDRALDAPVPPPHQ
jgi:hypothetical protein